MKKNKEDFGFLAEEPCPTHMLLVHSLFPLQDLQFFFMKILSNLYT